jgi:hypothetical protein
MRAKVILSASVLALIVLVPALYFHYKQPGQTPAVEPNASEASPNAGPSALPAILHRVAGAAHAPDSVPVQENNAADLKAAGHEEYVAQREAELSQMGTSREPGALKTILAEVHNADPDIRQAALSAAMDFGSKDAIPTLRNEITLTEDLQEKVEIQKAIDFLQLQPFELDENGGIRQPPADGSPSAAN